MVVEIWVENFRSIKDRQTLSFVPSPKDKLKGRLLHPPERPDDSLLPSLLVYGGNASGKSNLCQAIAAMRWVATQSSTRLNRGDAFPDIKPFRLDSVTASSPTRFGVTLMLGGELWEYELDCDAREIHREVLRHKANTPKARWGTIFHREGNDRAKWNGSIARLNGRLFSMVRDNGSVLSKAAAEGISGVNAVFDAIEQMQVLSMARSSSPTILDPDPKAWPWIAKLLACADVPISEFRVRDDEWNLAENVDSAKVQFVRKNESGLPVVFDAKDESDGTLRFLSLALLVYRALAEGYLLVLDEFDASLHPLLAEELRNAVNDPDLNAKGAQFIFATHNDTLLDSSRLRRDQVVLVERGESRGTEWFTLADLDRNPKRNESFQRRYLNGGYGGVPRIGDLRELYLEHMRSPVGAAKS